MRDTWKRCAVYGGKIASIAALFLLIPRLAEAAALSEPAANLWRGALVGAWMVCILDSKLPWRRRWIPLVSGVLGAWIVCALFDVTASEHVFFYAGALAGMVAIVVDLFLISPRRTHQTA